MTRVFYFKKFIVVEGNELFFMADLHKNQLSLNLAPAWMQQ